MTFAKKLYLLIAIAVVGLLAIGVFGIVQINSVYVAANYANENSLPSIEQIDDATEAMFRMRIAVWKHIASNDVEGKKSSMEEISKRQHLITDALDNYEKEHLSDETDRQLLYKDRTALSDYYAARDSVLALSTAGNFEEARRLQLSIQAPIKQADQALAQHRAYNVSLATEGATRAAATSQHATLFSAVIALLVTGAVTIAGIVLVRRLVLALREAVDLAQAVSGGDLSRRVEVAGNDEISQLQRALSHMSSKLTDIIGEVQSSAIAIQTASTEIASGNMDLSARTEQQAGALEETASSMEELTSTVQHNADNSSQARQLAGEAAETAKHGGQVVAQVVDTMAAISDASHQIVDIISVIDAIAFQTNILALNAAVEAARAGEQGRGFAVVATEVRNLAHRSAAAAKEIKSLIGNASGQVQQGGVLVEQAGIAMQRIVTSVQRVADVIGEISEAGREQSAGIQQINQAVTQMDDMTQRNAALVEESAAAAVAMRDQADTLTKLVGHFQLQPTTQRTIKASREFNGSTARLALAGT